MTILILIALIGQVCVRALDSRRRPVSAKLCERATNMQHTRQPRFHYSYDAAVCRAFLAYSAALHGDHDLYQKCSIVFVIVINFVLISWLNVELLVTQSYQALVYNTLCRSDSRKNGGTSAIRNIHKSSAAPHIPIKRLNVTLWW